MDYQHQFQLVISRLFVNIPGIESAGLSDSVKQEITIKLKIQQSNRKHGLIRTSSVP